MTRRYFCRYFATEVLTYRKITELPTSFDVLPARPYERLAAKYAKDAIIKLQTGDKEVKGGKTQRVYGMVGLSDSDG